MDRSRLVALLLLGTALSGCSTASSETPKQAASNQVAPTVPGRSLAVDLDAQIRQAQVLRSSGDFAGATKMLSQLMLVAPDDPRVVGEYGKVLVQEGRSRDALDFLKRGVQLAPGDWTLYSATGVAYDQNGDYANAKIAYQQALAIKPGNAGVLNNYALSRMQAGDLAGARQLMAQASSGGAGDPDLLLAGLLHDCGKSTLNGRGVGLLPRIGWSLSEAFGPWILRLARPLPGMRPALDQLRHHAQRSAELVLAAGGSVRTAGLIRGQDVESAESGPGSADPAAELLRLADEAN